MHNMMVKHQPSLNEVENTHFYDIVKDLSDDNMDTRGGKGESLDDKNGGTTKE
jgi:hypothetical protein